MIIRAHTFPPAFPSLTIPSFTPFRPELGLGEGVVEASVVSGTSFIFFGFTFNFLAEFETWRKINSFQ